MQPANDDIPEDEMFLAKLLQNAGARGWRAHRGSYFLSKDNEPIWALREQGYPNEPSAEDMIGCCADGARIMEPDTKAAGSRRLISGNDRAADETWFIGEDNHETVGYAFQLALGGVE